MGSLSARRAWIEISPAGCWRDARRVALRKESVDRNDTVQIVIVVMHASLSARRAWIEILGSCIHDMSAASLSARRAWIEMMYVTRLPRAQVCRSPQGERG